MKKEVLDKQTWNILRVDLNNAYDFSIKWEKVIKLFRKRIDDFYFTPIEKILEPNSQKGEGFSILTLQCALIEMFAAFKTGQIYIQGKRKFKFEYTSSSNCFVAFLQTESIFENHFFVYSNGVKQINQPYNAKDFYERVRCGLMHEARTKLDWRITANPKKTSSKVIFIGKDNQNNNIVHRSNLHYKLKEYFENIYLAELRQTAPNGNVLRRFLARKLDHLHDIPPDTSYDWWDDR